MRTLFWLLWLATVTVCAVNYLWFTVAALAVCTGVVLALVRFDAKAV